VAETGLSCFHWDTKSGTSSEFRLLAGPRLALMGGINNYTLLRGAREEVAVQCDAAIAAGIDVVGPECAIPLATPLRNLKAIASNRTDS
jgi:[methyl-Co(III) methanol-specific corrinoid protein]:coenzyme M methyltransferase